MQNLAQILKNWNYDRRMLTSTPFYDDRSYQTCKQMLIRAWIHAEYDDARRLIRISLNSGEQSGKANIEKMEKMNLTWNYE